jgi:transglutaminase-like putative cysteine protease
VRLLRPLPRAITRSVSILILVAWAATMAALIHRSYLQASAANLATDLARYGTDAQWRGVYYRGEKIGFTVAQTVAADDGFELHEDGRLQMSLLGAVSVATLHTTARVDRDFTLRSFEFALDPGTGAVEVRGDVDGRRLKLSITSAGATRTEERELPEPPVLSLSLPRRLASGGLTPGARHQVTIFDPATLRNAPMTVTVGARELVRLGDLRTVPLPAFKVEMEFAGLRTRAWVTDTGEVVREESPLGFMTVRETPEQARRLAVPGRVQTDLLEASAVVPVGKQRIDEPRDVRRLRVRLEGADLSSDDVQGAGQRVQGDVVEIVDARTLSPGAIDPDARRFLDPEPFIESDAPEIRKEVDAALGSAGTAATPRAKAERLTRYVNALLEKKPTISLPSARDVLRTKVGDCNEHTALFVAMARAAGIPARIAVGLAFARGAFYYHAWPEVFLDEGGGRGLWLPVDPTFNQFPADATHLRLARGGLDKQAAIVPLIGRLKMTIVDLELAPGSTPILIGRPAGDLAPLPISVPRRDAGGCWYAVPRPRPR